MSEETALAKREQSVAVETAHMREQREHYKWILGLAKGMYDSGMCPEGIQSAAQTAQIMLVGEAYGLNPAVAVQQIGCFKGRIVMPSALMVGLVRRAGLGTFSYEQGDGWVKVIGKRTETGESFTSTWNRERVERSGVNRGKDGIKFPWKAFELEMMRHKAEAEVCRALFQDLLMGVYAPEELPDEPTVLVESPTSRTEAIKQALGLPPAEMESEPDTTAEGDFYQRRQEQRGIEDKPQSFVSDEQTHEKSEHLVEHGRITDEEIEVMRKDGFTVTRLEDIDRKPKADNPKWVGLAEVINAAGIPTHTIYEHQINGGLSCSCGESQCRHIEVFMEMAD